jgi:hypothetical protein
MITFNSANYEYPSSLSLVKTTQKINELHQLAQGKIVVIQVSEGFFFFARTQ